MAGRRAATGVTDGRSQAFWKFGAGLSWLMVLLPVVVRAEDAGPLLLLTRPEAEAIRSFLDSGEPEAVALSARLRRDADLAGKVGPWSVTAHRPEEVSGLGRHDYYSEGPYWWPDPKGPGGRYLRRDGERYPGRFTANHDDLRSMSKAVLDLGMGAYFLQERRYAESASRILEVWFLDERTRMTPHLEFGQAVRGLNTGRGNGLIDTVPLIWAAQGMLFLEASGCGGGETLHGVRTWFGKFLEWMTGSRKGLDEKKSGNNHSTWWTSQVAAYSIFVRDGTRARQAWQYYRDVLVPLQIQLDGSCPREEARTNSLAYSTMNLNGFATLCRMAEVQGEDLWRVKSLGGASLERAIAYLAPFVASPSTWKKQQITPYAGGQASFLLLAGLGLRREEYLELYCQIGKDNDPSVLPVQLLVKSKRFCATRER